MNREQRRAITREWERQQREERKQQYEALEQRLETQRQVKLADIAAHGGRIVSLPDSRDVEMAQAAVARLHRRHVL